MQKDAKYSISEHEKSNRVSDVTELSRKLCEDAQGVGSTHNHSRVFSTSTKSNRPSRDQTTPDEISVASSTTLALRA